MFSSANVTIQMTTELQSSGCRLGTRIARLCKGFGKYFPTRGLAGAGSGQTWEQLGPGVRRRKEEDCGEELEQNLTISPPYWNKEAKNLSGE